MIFFGNTKIPKSWKIKPTERLVPATQRMLFKNIPENSGQALHAFVLLTSTHHSPIPASIEQQATVFIGKLAATACTTMSWSGGGNLSKVVLRRWLLHAVAENAMEGTHTHTICKILLQHHMLVEFSSRILYHHNFFWFICILWSHAKSKPKQHSIERLIFCDIQKQPGMWSHTWSHMIDTFSRSFMPKLPTFVWESRFTQSMFIQSQQQSLLRWVGNDTLWLFPDD